MQQGERQQTHTDARSRRDEMMAAEMCQSLTAWPPILAREGPMTTAYTCERELQLLTTHSTLANGVLASPRVVGARTMQWGQYAWSPP